MYCVIGKKLPHTLSPQIHREMGLGDYGVVELENEAALANFVKSRAYRGYNVTIPYKQAVMPFLDIIDAGASAIGAVNTVVQRGGTLFGYNTDVIGMQYALKSARIELSGKNVLVLGSGGTSKTACYVAEKAGVKSLGVVSREGALNYENCYRLKNTEVIINTTPVGMMPDAYAAPIDISRFENLKGVFDAIYNPLETLLVSKARQAGIPAANGLKMLTEQARSAHNIFASEDSDMEEADESQTARVYSKLISELHNIVLIGMAGTGKSTIGRALAKKLNREFIDTDEEIVKAAGLSIPEIFAAEGEAAFREREKLAVGRACSQMGAVIATGGGAVLDEKNRFFMKSNGKTVLILRDLEKLDTKGRPLSDSLQKARRVWEQRKQLYFSFADIVAKNYTTVDCATEDIINKL